MTISEARQKLVALAQSQVGYTEGPNNYNKYADDPKVIQLYGWCPQNQPWCCVFANWCYLNAFGYDVGSRLTYGGTAACSASAQLFMNNGAYVHIPEIGDQAFFNVSGGINHTGIVVAVEGTIFTTVEGNYSDKVSLVQHNVGHADVAGFGRPCWKIVQGESFVPSDGDSSDDPFPVPHSKVLRKGMSGDDVRQLQEALIELGYDVGPDGADGQFGKNTYNAVIAFQKDHGLVADGEVGPLTYAAIEEAMAEDGDVEPEPDHPDDPDDGSNPPPDKITLPLTLYGDKGEPVVLLQSALNIKGYNAGKDDGDFGPQTLAAVNRFKEAEGLEPNGEVDEETWLLVLFFF